MLNTEQWQYFNLDKLFRISAGIYHYSDEYDIGITPYVSASNVNNGIQQRIDLNPDFEFMNEFIKNVENRERERVITLLHIV